MGSQDLKARRMTIVRIQMVLRSIGSAEDDDRLVVEVMVMIISMVKKHLRFEKVKKKKSILNVTVCASNLIPSLFTQIPLWVNVDR